MKWLLLLAVLFLASPVIAGFDNFTINTVYGSPTSYLIDYGENQTAYVYNYTITSSTAIALNQTWLMLGSVNETTITTLDAQGGQSFAAGIEQIYNSAAPDYYRYYYFVLQNGFYDPSDTLTLSLYSDTKDIVVFPTPPETPSPTYIYTDSGDSYSLGFLGIFGVFGLFGFLLISKKKKK